MAVALAQKSIAKGLMMAAFGLWLSTVGIDAVNGEPRFTFGILDLQDGIDLVPVLTGVFAITEITSWIQERGTIARLGRLEGSVWRGQWIWNSPSLPSADLAKPR